MPDSKDELGRPPVDWPSVRAVWARASRYKKAEGTGLGLTLCRKFVELHGGRILGEERGGYGSSVQLRAAGATWRMS